MKAKTKVNKVEGKKTKKFDFSDSYKAIKTTAKSVNTKMSDVADEVFDDVSESTSQLKEMTIVPIKKAYKKAIDKVSETMTLENVGKATKRINNYTLKTADELVDGVLVNGEKWQGLAHKAIKGGLKLTAKNQAIVFDALTIVKGQLTDSKSRFKKLFSNN